MGEQRFTIQKASGMYLHLPIFDNGVEMADGDVCILLNEQQSTINELQSIINHIKCEENCFDYDYCCETVCSLYNEIRHLKEENEQLKEELNNLKKDETMLYHYYTLARYGGDGV